MLLGLGALTLLAPLPRALGQVLLLDGCVALVAVLAALWRRRRDDAVLVEVLGATLALLAALLWVRVEASVVVPLLAGFVVLTIAAERVELAALHLPVGASRVLVLLSLPVAASATAAVVRPDVGARAFGGSLALLVLWLAPRDVAVRMVRTTGLPRFAAAAMLAGYAWLGVAAASWVLVGATSSARAHDLVVHALFLGFAMSMVLAHAPVILPACSAGPCPTGGPSGRRWWCCTWRSPCGWSATSWGTSRTRRGRGYRHRRGPAAPARHRRHELPFSPPETDPCPVRPSGGVSS